MIVTFHSEARRELFAYAGYYDEQVEGLGNEFISEVEIVIEVISREPYSGFSITNTEKRFLIPRFPYALIYSIEGNRNNSIVIYAVMHLRRKPGYWTSRV